MDTSAVTKRVLFGSVKNLPKCIAILCSYEYLNLTGLRFTGLPAIESHISPCRTFCYFSVLMVVKTLINTWSVASRECQLVFCIAMLVDLANYITRLLGGEASYMQGSGRLGIVSDVYWVKVVDISYLYGRLDTPNLLNMPLFAPKVVAWDLYGVGLNVPYKNPLPKLPRPGRLRHSFFLLYIFVSFLLFVNKTCYLSF